MSTMPKAKKYRLARPAVVTSASSSDDVSPKPVTQDPEAAGQETAAKTTSGATRDSQDMTPRQLRIARRLAQRHGLAPSSDAEAVEMLRARGIDPFQNTQIVGLATTAKKPANSSGNAGSVTEGKVNLPQKREKKERSPSTDVIGAEQRASEIRKIQQDIARRRRIRLGLLFLRLTIFVFIPTMIAGYYFTAIATPMYSSKSEFLILNADGGGQTGGFGGLIPSQFATGQDSIATQSYLESQDAMIRLDGDVDFKRYFQSEDIDPIQRLASDASNDDAYKLYQRYVKLGYDQTEGVIRMEVSTPDPEFSLRVSEALIDYAEERVDALSQEKRVDAVKTAVDSLEDAKAARREAQQRLVKLQESTIFDPQGEVAGIRTLITTVETELQSKELALRTQLLNPRPNRARVTALEAEIEILQKELESQNARLNEAQSGAQSLAAQTAEIRMAESDIATADMILQSALETKRQSEIEANRQVRYLTVSVQPLATDKPSYPKSFQDTLIAFLIFSGIYLMISLTVSILREQVSS